MMKFGIRTIFIFVSLVAICLTIYKSFYAPPVLRVGMSQEKAIAALRRANAADVLRLRISSKITPIKGKPKPMSQQQIAELNRFSRMLETVPYSTDNFGIYWYLPTVGRFETHFEDGKLASVARWSGRKTETLDSLRLELRPDDPHENAGIPNDF